MNAKLTRGQKLILAAATLPMIGAGGLGAWGTYTNITAEFGRAATALGVVAAGEGVTLVLALVMVGLTMLGQSAPAPVRAGLWGAPIAAAITGIAVADNPTEAVVYAMTPMAMCASAEGLGLLARRVVVHRTGLDMEAQRRNAETVQRLAYHRARAANHPNERARKRSERASWRLARRVGLGDAELGARLVEVQRDRLQEGADAALAGMLAVPTAPQLLAAEQQPEVTTPESDEPDTRQLERFDFDAWAWTPAELVPRTAPAVGALPAEQTRDVVTEVVTITPTDLRRKARKLNREAVADTGRPVTIDTLRDELGLSRRDAAELRHQVVEEVAR